MRQFTIADALEYLAIAERPISSADHVNDTQAFRDHWQALGALKVILRQIADRKDGSHDSV